MTRPSPGSGAGSIRRTRRRLKDQPDQTTKPTTFPGYVHVTEIASGAFAAVYRATEVETGRPVALKLLKLSVLSSHVGEAYEREVKALGALGAHPNIVTLFRTLTTPDGRPVLVLELCQFSMAERVRQHGPLPVSEAVTVGIKIAGALETAHRAGLLQRDMKPQNILVTQYGEPALADFGVAALQASAQTTEGVFGFTTLHAPPEVLEGRPLSPATDVYGLASTIYQLIAGRAPFAAFDGEAPASVILRILRDPVAPLRLDAVPLELSDLLQQALAKVPEQRPPSAAAFAEALRHVERSCGWPTTSYAVYGTPFAPGPGAAPPAPPAAVESEPAAVPRPPVAPAAPIADTGPPPAPPGGGTSTGQGIVAPAAARRNVVAPQSSPPRTAAGDAREVTQGPSIRPARLSAPPAERPIFVDPPALPWPPATAGPATPRPPERASRPGPVWEAPTAQSRGPADGPYDQTVTHGGLTAALRANLESTPPFPIIDGPGRPGRIAIAVAAGVAVIVALIVVGLLTGVL